MRGEARVDDWYPFYPVCGRIENKYGTGVGPGPGACIYSRTTGVNKITTLVGCYLINGHGFLACWTVVGSPSQSVSQ